MEKTSPMEDIHLKKTQPGKGVETVIDSSLIFAEGTGY